MIEIKEISLLDIMPPNLLQDEKVRAAASAIDDQFRNVSKQIKYCLLLARLDEQDDRTLDLLAYQFHVDFYDSALPRETKRNLIRKSIDWHRHKGTPYAVQEIVAAILKGAVVKENWEYGGKPHCFKVELIEGAMVGNKTIEQLAKAIQATKNKRSHLDGVGFVRRPQQTVYIGGVIQQHKKAAIGLPAFTMPNIAASHCFTSVHSTHKEVKFSWQTGMV